MSLYLGGMLESAVQLLYVDNILEMYWPPLAEIPQDCGSPESPLEASNRPVECARVCVCKVLNVPLF